jgi:hypothetical protein
MSEQENSRRHNQPSGEQRNSRLNENCSSPPRKMSSVLELAKYKVGDSAWWVTLRHQKEPPELSVESVWMQNCHPKTLYEHGPYKCLWPFRSKLPRLHHSDFTGIVIILTSEFAVEQFDICDIIRSSDTGEFFYSNQNDEWMPEAFLFDTQIAANQERSRILKMMKRWVES